VLTGEFNRRASQLENQEQEVVGQRGEAGK